MRGKLLIAFLLVGWSLQQCTLGCLKCNSLNQCVVCDSSNNYFLNGNTCSLSTQTNCNVLGLTGACASCNTNYYLDVNSQRCLAISNSSLIANCATYNSGQVCVLCSGNAYLVNGQCVAINATIANCQVYNSAQQCVQCASGYVVNIANSACVAVSSSANCLYYTYLGCRACQTGFVMNANLYFTNYGSASYIAANYLGASTAQKSFDWIGLSVCQAVTVRNCVSYSAFNACTTCSAGFFLQNGNCVAFPLPIIFGCQTYSTLTTCVACQAGYYLSSNSCVVNTLIPNCLTYSGSATTSTCVACNTGFYLQGNACVNRTLSAAITNCQTVAVAADACGACANGFVLTSDSRACLPAISNCASYAAGSTFQSSALQCSACNNGFYLTNSGSTNLCVAGTVTNCLTYQVNANTCTVCQNSYYLSGNTCVAHINIANCATYDPTRANFCATCNTGFYNFAYTTVCVATTVLSNCVAYAADGNSCIRCATGYYINGNSCSAIPATFANCATFASSQCSLCNAGYMVNTLPTVGSCTLPLDYISAASNSPCAILLATPSGLTPTWTGSASATQFVMSCGTCGDYSYGYVPIQPEAICVNTNQLTLYNGFATVTNCLRYGLNYASSPAVVCMQCAAGFFISGYNALAEKTTATTCTSTCTTEASFRTSSGVIVDDMLGFVNICIANTGTAIAASGRCSRYGRVILDNVGAAANQINDYQCFAVYPGTNSAVPLNVLMYDTLQASLIANAYVWDSPNASTQQSSVITGVGYSNTVDSSSLYPNVFNYLGIMMGPNYAAQLILPQITTAPNTPPDVTAALIGSGSLANCDIAAYYMSTNYGNPNVGHDAGLTADATAFSKYGCLRCAFGYQVSYVGTSSASTIAAFPGCSQMTNCASSSTVHGGLPQFLNSVLSCHVCSQSSGASLFPTINYEYHFTTGAWIGWSAKGLLTVNGNVVTVAAANGFKCAAAPSSLQTSTSTSVTAITNCAVYGTGQAVTTVPPTNSGTHISASNSFCLACAANYWPSYLGATAGVGNAGAVYLPNYAVTACTASVNCDTSVITQFNGCGKCRSDQENLAVPVYYAFMDLTLSNCYQAASKNCLILSTTGFSTTSTTNVCDVCKAGYFMNADSQCEQYRVPNEAVNNGIFVNAYVAARAYVNNAAATFTASTTDNRLTRLHYLLSYKQLQYGVTACSSGYTFAPANSWAPRLCVWSSYVYNNTGNFPASSNFINNCVRYNLTQVNAKNVCGGCTTGFIPTQDGTACVSAGTVPNCFYAQNSPNNALCYQCLPNFNNVNGVCSAAAISNCATYINNRWSFTTPSALTCSACINGFVLSADGLSCTPGTIANCIQYSQGRSAVCTACRDNFVLMTLNTVYYCYPIPASLNCAILQDTSPTSGANYGTISCATCNAGATQVFGTRQWTGLGLTTQAQTMCMPFTPIANCNVYDQASTIIKANTFGCTQCASGFWYSAANYTCVARTNVPTQCLTYNLRADVCTSCGSGSFLSADGTNCVAFPTGIFQCRTYSASNVCTQCNAPYYLANNACVISTVVANCQTYAANFTCSVCSSGFYLQNSTACVTATATNCLTYTSMTACASCAAGFGLQTTNGVTNCVAVNLANCVNATTVAPFTCLTCTTGFFPNTNGVCTAVSSTIPNCLTYDTATTCSICSASSVLNVARTACNATAFATLADANCAQNILLNAPACTQCSPGNFFVNGTCSSCTNNTYTAGCFSCDPTNNNVCLMCRPTYYMNAAGGCVATVAANNNTNITVVNNNTSNATASGLTVGIAVALVSIFFELA